MTEMGKEQQAVQVAGNATVHAGRRIGTYESGRARWAKVCSGLGRDRHDPGPVDGGAAAVTCKRCIVQMAKREGR